MRCVNGRFLHLILLSPSYLPSLLPVFCPRPPCLSSSFSSSVFSSSSSYSLSPRPLSFSSSFSSFSFAFYSILTPPHLPLLTFFSFFFSLQNAALFSSSSSSSFYPPPPYISFRPTLLKRRHLPRRLPPVARVYLALPALTSSLRP